MGILSDADILKSIAADQIGISNYSEKSLTPNGYDLRISEISLQGSEEVYREGTVKIPAGRMFFVSTVESVKLPDNVCAQLWMRTSYIRKGIMATFGKIDAGFQGTLTLGAFNAGQKEIEIPIGDRFCQIVFESMDSASEKSYAKRSGNYQNQNGITLKPKN